MKRASDVGKSNLFLWLFSISLLLLSSCACINTWQGENLAASTPGSYRIENVAPFNAKIEEAVKKGEVWPGDPILIALNLLKISNDGARLLVMSKESSPAENPDRTGVTVIRDGFLDDSLRGDWHYFELRKMNDQGWRFTEIRRAFLCRRGIQMERPGKEFCP
ncbi:MAG: hypothetical protein NTV99_10820 [Deltaproteobacteria bacterium]|nr:hypothetical protein [Deltaproteobacteria bacterium]